MIAHDLIKVSKKHVDGKCTWNELRRMYVGRFPTPRTVMTKKEVCYYFKKMQWGAQAKQAIKITEHMFAYGS